MAFVFLFDFAVSLMKCGFFNRNVSVQSTELDGLLFKRLKRKLSKNM